MIFYITNEILIDNLKEKADSDSNISLVNRFNYNVSFYEFTGFTIQISTFKVVSSADEYRPKAIEVNSLSYNHVLIVNGLCTNIR